MLPAAFRVWLGFAPLTGSALGVSCAPLSGAPASAVPAFFRASCSIAFSSASSFAARCAPSVFLLSILTSRSSTGASVSGATLPSPPGPPGPPGPPRFAPLSPRNAFFFWRVDLRMVASVPRFKNAPRLPSGPISSLGKKSTCTVKSPGVIACLSRFSDTCATLEWRK